MVDTKHCNTIRGSNLVVRATFTVTRTSLTTSSMDSTRVLIRTMVQFLAYIGDSTRVIRGDSRLTIRKVGAVEKEFVIEPTKETRYPHANYVGGVSVFVKGKVHDEVINIDFHH